MSWLQPLADSKPSTRTCWKKPSDTSPARRMSTPPIPHRPDRARISSIRCSRTFRNWITTPLPEINSAPRSDGGQTKRTTSSESWLISMALEIGNGLLDFLKIALMFNASIAGRKSSIPNSSKAHGYVIFNSDERGGQSCHETGIRARAEKLELHRQKPPRQDWEAMQREVAQPP